MRINTDCNELIIGNQAYSTPENFFINEIKSFKSLTRKTYRCNTRLERDSFILKNKLLVKELTEFYQEFDKNSSNNFIKIDTYYKE